MAETIEGLKERRAWLLRQVEVTDRAIEKLLQKANAPRAPKPVARELPGVPPAPPPPPRKLSEHEENHIEYQTSRRRRLERLGVDYVPDEENTAAFIVITMKRLRDACRDDDELFAVFDAWLHDSWGASLKPPFPLRALGSEKVLRRLLDQVRAAAHAGAH
jgi:hypothetical protein